MVFLLLMAAQIYRSLREEKLLVSTFPEYQGVLLKNTPVYSRHFLMESFLPLLQTLKRQ